MSAFSHLFISEEAEQQFRLLKARWDDLLSWGVRERMPHVRGQIKAWDEFGPSWEDSPDVTRLNSAIADERLVEAYARDEGYMPGAVTPPPTGIDIEQGTPGLQASSAVNQAVPTIPNIPTIAAATTNAAADLIKIASFAVVAAAVAYTIAAISRLR